MKTTALLAQALLVGLSSQDHVWPGGNGVDTVVHTYVKTVTAHWGGNHRPTGFATFTRPAPAPQPAPTRIQAPPPPPPPPATSTFVPLAVTVNAPQPSTTAASWGNTGGSTGSSGGSAQGGDQQSALDKHNSMRSQFSLGDLSWDDDLTAKALSWAQTMAATGNFAHDTADENLYMTTGQTSSPLADGVQAWLDEQSKYGCEVIPQGDFEAYGHWTQVMWSKASKVGMASAVGPGGTYVVAKYDIGNMDGEKPYNC